MDNTVDIFDCYWQADNLENICGYNARKYGQQNVTGPYGPTTLFHLIFLIFEPFYLQAIDGKITSVGM